MEYKIQIKKTARYFSIGNIDLSENIWVILHGYGQLPQYFIKKFESLDLQKNFIIAPEGFHRFYLNGTEGRVGASWMTKEARLDDIKDNIQYLNQIAELFLSRKKFKRKFLLGFSQGGATASRWHLKGNYHADFLILWGSVFANDISFENDIESLFQSKNYFVVGNNDPYFKNQLHSIETTFEAIPNFISIRKFEGEHDIDTQMLYNIYEECLESKK